MWRTNLTLAIVAGVALLGLSVSAQASDPNLVAHWMFDEGSGTIAYDSAGNNDGTIYGATWTTGQIDGGLSFDGDGDYVNVGDDASLDITDEITISAWVYPVTWGDTDVGRIVSKGYYDDAAYRFVIDKDLLTTAGLLFHDGDEWEVSNTNIISLNTWQHVAVTTNSSTITFYVNGKDQGGNVGTHTLNSNNQPLVVGAGSTVEYEFNGTIDDVMVFNRSLSPEEIRQLYLKGLSGYERAIICVEDALAEKEEMLEVIDKTLEKEWQAYDALEELLESGDYGGLGKRDIIKARQEVHSAIQHQEQSIDALEKSIEKLEDSLTALGVVPELNEPNSPE
jgi:hypothetical protein